MRPSFQRRALTVASFFGLLALLVVGQIVRIQTMPQSDLIRERRSLYEGEYKVLTPIRGEIYDRNGHLLAGNKVVYEVSVNLAAMQNAHTVAQALSVYLGLDYSDLYNQLTDPAWQGRERFITGHVPAEKKDALETLAAYYDAQAWDPRNGARPSLAGLVFQPRYDRSYPEGSLASNVIGYYNWNRVGNFGVEEHYDELLAGSPITVWVPSDPNQSANLPRVPDGTSLVLTIDRELQASLEALLDQALRDTGSRSGLIVVMDPRSGEIYAMAVSKRMDLNEFWNYARIYDNVVEFNPAVSRPYEPGSVVKIFTMAAALDSGLVRPETTYYDNGVLLFAGYSLRNWDGGAWGRQDMIGCLQHSLNVCLAALSTSMGQETFYDYMQRFGLGRRTGVDLAGEAAGRLKLPGDADWALIDLATNAYGQGVDITAVQMLMAASAIANDGRMVMPHVLKALLRDGRSSPNRTPTVGMPIRPETARTLSEMLAISLENEASAALVPGYRIAGKTGTAQIPTPYGYDPDDTNASFIGWGPVDDPRFMVYVWLERPQSSPWGSRVAAPLFAQAVERTVVLLGIPPDSVRQQLAGR